VHYKNGVTGLLLTCGFQDTHAYYDRNHAIGRGDGVLIGTWTVIVSGAWAGALSVHNRTERTLS
jgi:hypothetical protein